MEREFPSNSLKSGWSPCRRKRSVHFPDRSEIRQLKLTWYFSFSSFLGKSTSPQTLGEVPHANKCYEESIETNRDHSFIFLHERPQISPPSIIPSFLIIRHNFMSRQTIIEYIHSTSLVIYLTSYTCVMEHIQARHYDAR